MEWELAKNASRPKDDWALQIARVTASTRTDGNRVQLVGQGIIVKLFSSDPREAFVRVGDAFPHRAIPREQLLVTSRVDTEISSSNKCSLLLLLTGFRCFLRDGLWVEQHLTAQSSAELNETARLVARHRFESSRFHNMTPPVK